MKENPEPATDLNPAPAFGPASHPKEHDECASPYHSDMCHIWACTKHSMYMMLHFCEFGCTIGDDYDPHAGNAEQCY